MKEVIDNLNRLADHAAAKGELHLWREVLNIRCKLEDLVGR